jgi:hypothetical protein
MTSNAGKTPGEDRLGNPRKRNATNRCRAGKEFDGSGGWDRKLGINGVSIAELNCEIRERNNQATPFGSEMETRFSGVMFPVVPGPPSTTTVPLVETLFLVT